MGRSKREIFHTEAEKRFKRFQQACDGLKELSSTRRFEYETDEVDRVIGAMEAEMQEVRRAFEPRAPRLSFGEEAQS